MSAASESLNEILGILHTVKEDKKKLAKILDFLREEIYEEPPPVEVPKRYKEVVKEIAGNLSVGLESYLNTDSLEVEFIHPAEYAEYEDFEDEEDEEETDSEFKNGWEKIPFKHKAWENCISFMPLESHESFRIMKEFTQSLTDSRFQDKLVHALNRSHPFSNFNDLIHSSKYRQDWFDFRQQWLEDYVKESLLHGLDDLEKMKKAE